MADPEVASTGAQSETAPGVGHAEGSGGVETVLGGDQKVTSSLVCHKALSEAGRVEDGDDVGKTNPNANRAEGSGGSTSPEAGHAEGSSGDTNPEAGRAEGSGGDPVQEGVHDGNGVQPAAWKVAGDVEVLDVE